MSKTGPHASIGGTMFLDMDPIKTGETRINLSLNHNYVPAGWMEGKPMTGGKLSSDGYIIEANYTILAFKWKGWRFSIWPIPISDAYQKRYLRGIKNFTHFEIPYDRILAAKWFINQGVAQGRISESVMNLIKSKLEEYEPGRLRINDPPPFITDVHRMVGGDPEIILWEPSDTPDHTLAAREWLSSIRVKPQYDYQPHEHAVFMASVGPYDFWYLDPTNIIVVDESQYWKYNVSDYGEDAIGDLGWRIAYVYKMPFKWRPEIKVESLDNLHDFNEGLYLIGIRKPDPSIGTDPYEWVKTQWDRVGSILNFRKIKVCNHNPTLVMIDTRLWDRHDLVRVPEKLVTSGG